MTKRERKIQTLVRRIGPMRTMLLVGLIDTLPDRKHDAEGFFIPDHSLLQRVMKVKQPIYWHLLGGLIERGLVTKRFTEQHGKQYKVEFEAIEKYTAMAWAEAILIAFRAAFGIKRRRNA